MTAPVVIEKQVIVDFEKESLDDVYRAMVINGAAGNSQPTDEKLETEVMRQTQIDTLECLELLDAVVTGDFSELRDALADKRVTLNGFATILPFSLSDDYEKVIQWLFTRFDSSLDDAIRTHEKYKAIGVTTYIEKNTIKGLTYAGSNTPKEYHVNKVKETVTGTDGEIYPKGKFLKSINYNKGGFPTTQPKHYKSHHSHQQERWGKLRPILSGFIEKMDERFNNTDAA